MRRKKWISDCCKAPTKYVHKRRFVVLAQDDGHYVFVNCCFIELSENARLGNLGRRKLKSL